jgi:hypothetical protein
LGKLEAAAVAAMAALETVAVLRNSRRLSPWRSAAGFARLSCFMI